MDDDFTFFETICIHNDIFYDYGNATTNNTVSIRINTRCFSCSYVRPLHQQ